MNAVTKKLKSKSGVSMAIALVFFLLCAMVGTVVLSAASAGAGSTARERQLYRETLALTSAADLLSKDIQAIAFTGSYTRTEIVTTTVDLSEDTSTKAVTSEKYQSGVPTLTGSRLFRVVRNADGSESDNLNVSARYYQNQEKLSGGTVTEPQAQTIIFQAVKAQNIPEVTGSITVEQDYTLTVVLKCGKNSITMSFPPRAASRTQVADPVITRVNNAVTQKSTTATYSVSITWGKPLLKEGGADHAKTP